eukprot:4602956-Pyramimonas_sp.AAC.1
MSALLQFYQRGGNIGNIAGNFAAVGSALEVIVNDDSMSDGAHWINSLKNVTPLAREKPREEGSERSGPL